ncbi:transcriptional repressor [Geomonas silvestris]|uniref:Transcriptional repressor n=1 Tax=Geomonas silvestris TaxID=2740184 RepID=A0A6V8MNW1_9BACT|nr:transcriptional repressor [Geomonas silvestris]GFO61745.1 transcriptional repressor [Geomonas silvestris]
MLEGLKKSGCKLTPQRRSIVEVITRDRSHPSALGIYQACREEHPNISLSTVYATLAVLKRLRLVKELEFEGMDNRYDRDTEDHLNLICTRCGKIEDFTDSSLVPPKVVEQHTGFKVHDIRFEYYGLCSTCSS